MRLDDLPTPCLILDRRRVEANTRRMAEHLTRQGVALRPHLKTAKSAEVARLATAGHPGGITVSTLAEAAYFVANGFRDLTYAVGIVPGKLDAVARLQQQGASITLLTDDLGVAEASVAAARRLGTRFRILIEIDTGGGRAGLAPDAPEVLALGRLLHAAPEIDFAGVLTHAGHSYHCHGIAEVEAVAEEERAGVVAAAEALRAAGVPCPTVSAGSTPTAIHARRFDGLTEVRPGNYVFFDLFQVGVGSCRMEDVAVSVLASVIGHHRGRNQILIDAGGLALSKDVGANEHAPGTAYGLIARPTDPAPLPGLAVLDVHQEHGIIAHAKGLDAIGPLDFAAFPVGSRLRVLPNHVCMTAASYDRYHVVDGGDVVTAVWDRVNGWQA